MNRFHLGVLLVILSAAGFGMIPIFALYAYKGGATVTTILLLRNVLSALLLFGYIFIKHKKISISKSSLKYLFIMGGIFYTLQSTLYFSAVKFIPASLAVLLYYSYPIFVTIASVIFEKEVLTKTILTSISFSILGLIMVLGNSFGSVHYLGVLLALGAAVVFSGYLILGNRVLKQSIPLETTAFITLFAAVSFSITGFSSGTLNFDLAFEAWVAIAGVTFISTILAMFTLFRGLELIGSTRTSIISTIEPLVTIFFSAMLFHEHLTWLQVIGGAAVLSGAMLVVTAREETSIKDAPLKPKVKEAGTH